MLSDNSFLDEPFVIVEASSWVEPCMQYPILGMHEAEQRCIMRRSVRDKLLEASRALPAGMRFRIWDAWRPYKLQVELYDHYRAQIVDTFNLQGLPCEEQDAVITNYVAVPRNDRLHPPAHTTGGAIDLTLVNEDGAEVPMGTPFDSFNLEASTFWFEDSATEDSSDDAHSRLVFRDNRRILHDALVGVGFSNLDSEWWHYDYGNDNWSSQTGNLTLYKGCFSQDELTFAAI